MPCYLLPVYPGSLGLVHLAISLSPSTSAILVPCTVPLYQCNTCSLWLVSNPVPIYQCNTCSLGLVSNPVPLYQCNTCSLDLAILLHNIYLPLVGCHVCVYCGLKLIVVVTLCLGTGVIFTLWLVLQSMQNPRGKVPGPPLHRCNIYSLANVTEQDPLRGKVPCVP